jgi:glycosyltransferase involved in cell wall biosynthesis
METDWLLRKNDKSGMRTQEQKGSPQKKRILMILHLPEPVHGAAIMGKYLKRSELINREFEIDYINLSTSSSLRNIGKAGIRKMLSSFSVARKVFIALISRNYDLCYMTLTSSGSGFYKDLLVVSLLKLARKKIVYHFHNKGVIERQSRKIDNILYQFAFRNTRSIILSPVLYSDLKKYVRIDDVFVCENAIPDESESRAYSPGRTAINKKCRLLFLSHMMIEKGVIVLLDACALLMKKGFCFECHFVGGWLNISGEEFMLMVKARNLESHVFAHGAKYNADKQHLFNSSDVFVFPTLNECFGLVVLEAMSYGLPVVSTSEGALPDLVMDNSTGFVVEKNNSHALATKLATLIENPQLRQSFGQEGRRKFLENYTIEKFESRMLHILRHLTSPKTTNTLHLDELKTSYQMR